MWHAFITALLLVVMLAIVAGLIFSAWRAHQHYKRILVSQSRIPTHPLDSHTSALLQVQSASLIEVEDVKSLPEFSLPTSWYRRRRSIVSLGFLLMLGLTLFVQSGLADGTLKHVAERLEGTFGNTTKSIEVQISARPLPQTASVRLLRIDSGARNQYYSDYQWHNWMYASCSGIAMAMVMNSYGRNLIAADVLQKELDLGVWNTQLGLLREEGIALTAAHFGFETSASHTRTLQEVIAIANNGAPVIVSLRDSQYFPGGHIFVIRGGDSQYISIADSAPTNFQRMTHAMFLPMWQANQQFSAVLTPQK